MSASSVSADKGKYNWDSTHGGKLEYQQFWYKLCTNLENVRLSYCATEDLLIDRLPPQPEQSIAEIDAAWNAGAYRIREYATRMKMCKNQMKDYYAHDDDLGKAISILKLLFAYGSAPMSMIENQCAAHANNHDRWCACLEAINAAYKPDTGEDVQVLRLKLYSINDKEGYSKWQQQFTMTVNRMNELDSQPTDDELDAVVKKSIMNQGLIDAILAPHIIHKTFAWRQIIEECDNAMELPHIRATQKDLQPLPSASSSVPTMESLTRDVKALSAALGAKFNDQNNHAKGRGGSPAARGSPGPIKCGKCLREGHSTKQCTEISCSLCNGAMVVGEYHNCPQRVDPRTIRNTPKKVSNKRARSPPPGARTSEGGKLSKTAARAIRKVRTLATKSNEELLDFLASNQR